MNIPKLLFYPIILTAALTGPAAAGDHKKHDQDDHSSAAAISQESKACIKCHEIYTPGIVRDWQTSLHSRTTPAAGLKKELLKRRVSVAVVPEELADVAVGCYECHSRNPEKHKDNFKHNGYRINVVVSPPDCAVCHEKDVQQYSDSKKAHAIKNLMTNPVYHTLVESVNGVKRLEKGVLVSQPASASANGDTCLGCHGTKVEVRGMKSLKTAVGEMSVPDLTNWPNNGVGRENPDGSLGSCTACHPRHSFSIEVARKPYACGQCHLEPDVPAWNVYKASKHGNIFASKYHEWDFTAVPWQAGKDFTAPTCAVCHNSLVTAPSGTVIAERSHDFGVRLWVRIFGLPYTHPQPKSGNTTTIVNADGLPLPTTFTGIPATPHLIDPAEQGRRQTAMKAVCNSCHGIDWVNSHFSKLDKTLEETDAMTLTATQLLLEAWGSGVEDKSNPFDESIEKQWVKQWLFYGNSVRYAAAMTGAFDYAAFKNGWWELSENLQQMQDLLELKKLRQKRQPGHAAGN
jgi:hypothetical protein